ncbi:MAG: OsmC family protein [Elusimicrobiaceae bacterium]|nr:OsmC family protein [Elusimicrobiaceae bacterium]
MEFKISARYVGDDHVELTHAISGSKMLTDLPPDNGGRGRTFSPTDLLTAAVASCSLSIMAKFAAREGIKFEGAAIEIEKHMQENPRRVSALTGVVKLPAGLTQPQREKLMACMKACPVTRSLHPEVKLDFRAG